MDISAHAPMVLLWNLMKKLVKQVKEQLIRLCFFEIA